MANYSIWSPPRGPPLNKKHLSQIVMDNPPRMVFGQDEKICYNMGGGAFGPAGRGVDSTNLFPSMKFRSER